MEYLKANKTIFIFLAIGMIAITGCRKDDHLEFPAPNTGGTGTGGSGGGVGEPIYTPVSGTYWTDINPEPGDRIQVLATVEDKLFVSHLWTAGLSALYNGTTFAYCNQTILDFGSGSGLHKMQQSSDGTWLASGSMGAYGAYSWDGTNAGYPWGTAGYVLTNAYAAVKLGSETFIACGASPRVRSNGVQVGNDLDGPAYDLIEFEGELIAGGGFSTSGATAVNNVARWNGLEWLPLGTGLDGTVADLDIWEGKLVAVGSFEQNGDGNTDCKHVAVWDGVSWEPLGTGLSGSVVVGRKALNNGTELIIGGTFSYGGGVLSPNVIKWNGTNYEALAGGAPESIGEMAIYDGDLYISNQFLITNTNFLLRLD